MGTIVAIAIGTIVVFIGGVLAIANTKPGELSVRRQITIAAPPAKVFSYLNDFHKWPDWAPQDREDATMKRSYGGATEGVGATSAWTSDGSAGRGSMEITGSSMPERLTVTVTMLAPLKAHNVNEFVLRPSGNGATVTWSMHGTNPQIAKVMSVFVNMDTMLGKHFETGLANLKAAAER